MRVGSALLALWAPATAHAAQPITLALDGAHARIELRAYALGLLPLDGQFELFQGTLAVDPADARMCRIALQIAVASLSMPDPATARDMLSPALLDAARFPSMTFLGTCNGNGVAGTLQMHGVTRPVTLAVSRHGDIYRAEASLHRADWGVSGRPLAAGPNVRIRFEIRLPPPPAVALPAD